MESIPFEMKYYPCTVDLEERFEDIIGVTLPKTKKQRISIFGFPMKLLTI